MLPPDLCRLLGLLDDVGGLDALGISVAMREPMPSVIRWLDYAKARRLINRAGPWWVLSGRAFRLVGEA